MAKLGILITLFALSGLMLLSLTYKILIQMVQPLAGCMSSRSLEGAQPRQEEHFHAQPTAVAGQPPSPSPAMLTL